MLHFVIWILLTIYASLSSCGKSISPSDQKVWSVCNENGTCTCGPDLFDAVLCNEDEIRIQDCYCMFYDMQTNTSSMGTCFFSCFNRLSNDKQQYIFYSVEHYSISNGSLFNADICNNDFTLASMNREGRFCGRCKSGFGLAAYSYHFTACIECTDYGYKNWIKYFAIALLPLTLFVILIIVLKINVPSSHLNGVVFGMQIFTSPILMRT